MGVAELRFVGAVSSPLGDPEATPKQADEGAPPAILLISPEFAACCEGLEAGDRIVVLTWLDRADREAQTVQPRGDESRLPTGVFATRSPARPNPIGLHEVTVIAVSGSPDEPRMIEVDALEALDGTPILDLKPILATEVGER